MLRIVLTVVACLISPILGYFLWGAVAVLAISAGSEDPMFQLHGGFFGMWMLTTVGVMALLISAIRRFIGKPDSKR